ncbi:MAG: TetR/AcrR family transcriptional regulator [Candidatus Kapabacteria bacterium]|nr:TetR/AcrR family transcriptional regulator [Candidatus Kapabacteria bacterium]
MPIQKITREEILTKCVERFRTHGFHRTTMNDLAEVCGLQKGSFYHYFRCKDEILHEGLVQTRDFFADHIFTIAYDNDILPQERMKSMLAAHVAIMLRGNGGCLVANVSAETLNSTPEFMPLLREISDRWHAALTHILRSCRPSEEAESIAWRIMQDIEGAVMLSRLYANEQFTTEAVERSVAYCT